MATRTSITLFASQQRVALPGSEKHGFSHPEAQPGSASRAPITVSVIIRPKSPINLQALDGKRLSRAQFRAQHGADPAAVKLVQAFAKEFGLTAAPASPELRTLQLTGSQAAMERAFDVKLTHHKVGDTTYRVRQGSICIPSELVGVIEAVLGLDNRPQAKPHFRVQKSTPADDPNPASPDGRIIRAHAANVSYTPVQVAHLYGLPAGASATGQTIGILELGGGYRKADLTAYFQALGQATPTVTAVSVDKGKNAPSTADGADGEVMLDIEVAASVAAGAKIVVYFAPNTDQGFIDAISTAVHDTTNKPSILSISWGGPESSWTQQSVTALDQACQAAAALGVTITVACGDDGSTDGGTGNNVDFPASSPHVLACGGTKLLASGDAITSEVVWNELASNEGATGGGVSSLFPKPSWQSTANTPAPPDSNGGRGTPDVAGNADPATGYQIRVDGQTSVIGGTSAVAPLWAGILAVANAQSKIAAGFVNPTLYAANAHSAFRDITEGSNGAYSAGPGWDPCTGLGSPNIPNLLSLLSAASTTTTSGGGKRGGGKSGGGKRKGGGKKAPPKRKVTLPVIPERYISGKSMVNPWYAHNSNTEDLWSKHP